MVRLRSQLGNIYTAELAGCIYPWTNFGFPTDNPLQPPSNDAFYIVSLNNDGSKNWTKSWYGFNDVNSQAIDVVDNENIFVAGAFDYSIYFEDDTLIINSPAFGH